MRAVGLGGYAPLHDGSRAGARMFDLAEAADGPVWIPTGAGALRVRRSTAG